MTHYGPLARTVADAARYLDVVCGPDEQDPTSLAAPMPGFRAAIEGLLGEVRVGFVGDNGIAPSDPTVLAVVRSAVDDLVKAAGLREVPDFRIDLPDPAQHGGAPALYMLDRNPDDASAAAEAIGNLLRTPGAAPVIDSAFSNLDLSIGAIQGAVQARNALNNRLAAAFDDVDLLLMPTAPCVAFGAEGPVPTSLAGREVGPHAAVTYTSPFNLSGHPAVSVPAGQVDGLPVALQIVARRHEDTLALAAAAVLERIRPWPPLASAYATR
jgi:aspartyl-tRNA(Asn)/glutamyl-tRNA(Gln) amidotransferase subunit A